MFLIKDSPPRIPTITRENENANRYAKAGAFCLQLETAEGYGEIWTIVKDTVKTILGKSRVSMMLFLDNLPLSIGAYHSVGTNNIVLNRSLIELAGANDKSRIELNAFTYTLLTHEYLHALGYLSEDEVRCLVLKISRACFGQTHVATKIAQEGPWSLLKGVHIPGIAALKGPMEIVKDFENPNTDYIV